MNLPDPNKQPDSDEFRDLQMCLIKKEFTPEQYKEALQPFKDGHFEMNGQVVRSQ